MAQEFCSFSLYVALYTAAHLFVDKCTFCIFVASCAGRITDGMCMCCVCVCVCTYHEYNDMCVCILWCVAFFLTCGCMVEDDGDSIKTVTVL